MVRGTEIPKHVLELSRDQVVGLVIDPRRLADIRRSRMDYIAPGQRMTYDDELEVRDEVLWSRRVLTKHKIRTVDVTQRAIEETAHLVLSAVGKAQGPPPNAKRKTRRRA